MPHFVQPNANDQALRRSFIAAMREFEEVDGREDASLDASSLDSGDCLENYTQALREGTSMRAGVKPLSTCEWWWCEQTGEGLTYLGRVTLKHSPRGDEGHVDFSIRPTRRRQGHGAAMLAAALPLLHANGVTAPRVVCAADNMAARDVLQKCGALLESDDGIRCRYRFERADVVTGRAGAASG